MRNFTGLHHDGAPGSVELGDWGDQVADWTNINYNTTIDAAFGKKHVSWGAHINERLKFQKMTETRPSGDDSPY